MNYMTIVIVTITITIINYIYIIYIYLYTHYYSIYTHYSIYIHYSIDTIYIYHLYTILFHIYEQFTGGAPPSTKARAQVASRSWVRSSRAPLNRSSALEDDGKNPGKTMGKA